MMTVTMQNLKTGECTEIERVRFFEQTYDNNRAEEVFEMTTIDLETFDFPVKLFQVYAIVPDEECRTENQLRLLARLLKKRSLDLDGQQRKVMQEQNNKEIMCCMYSILNEQILGIYSVLREVCTDLESLTDEEFSVASEF